MTSPEISIYQKKLLNYGLPDLLEKFTGTRNQNYLLPYKRKGSATFSFKNTILYFVTIMQDSWGKWVFLNIFQMIGLYLLTAQSEVLNKSFYAMGTHIVQY